jgi:hypothetical protein
MAKKDKVKRRLIGVELTLDAIPKEELASLRFGFGFIDGKLRVRIETDKRIVSTNAIKGFRKENKVGFNLKKSYHKTNSDSLEPNAFLEGVDKVFAIDTNSKLIHGQKFFIGVISTLQAEIKDNGFADIQAVAVDYFCSQQECDKPENRNWKLFIEKYISDPSNTSFKTAIVVDSDLGLIDRFNSREVPIYADFFLPENVYLIYASADLKNDSIVNQLIAFCDEQATQCLSEL